MHPLAWSLVAAVAFAAMEGVAWLAHRYVMHGWGWGWHRSHHEPRDGLLEKNDWYAVVGTAAAIGLFLLAGHLRSHALQAIAAGVTAYGVAYSLVHDGLVHQRGPMRWVPRGGYLHAWCRHTGCTMRCARARAHCPFAPTSAGASSGG